MENRSFDLPTGQPHSGENNPEQDIAASSAVTYTELVSSPMKLLAFFFFFAACGSSLSQSNLTLEYPSQKHFLAAHGRFAWAAGYADGGIEIWAGALQLATEVKPEFRRDGEVTPIPADRILASVVVEPSSISRIYVGADFSVEENIFIPFDQTAAVIRYTVHSATAVRIIERFRPSLNLMWPAAIGGQSTRWDAAQSAYLISEPRRRFAAVVLAPDGTTHDETRNEASSPQSSGELSVALDAQSPQIVFAEVAPEALPSLSSRDFAAVRDLAANDLPQRQQAAKHYASVLSSNVQIETPDAELNRALAWAKIDLDQDWFCNKKLGCGYIAGFGPSRHERRPQYAWYFAGDGMVAMHAALAVGDLDHAREELRFISKYQDADTGMIWHEISQSAPYLDWRNDYPYMFVHADLTYPYISAVADYVRQSNDREFLSEIWPSAQKAFAYGHTLLADDALPRIPKAKEGANEQDTLGDELGLSASWIRACDDYSFLAGLMKDRSAARQAAKLSEQARLSFDRRYWDSKTDFVIQGYRRDGTAVSTHGVADMQAVMLHLFDDERTEHILDEVSSWRFQTDWGTRGLAMGEPGFDPTGYVYGSVSALRTAEVAQGYWSAHRPETAFQIWSGLLPWFELDSPGHMDELLRGDMLYPQSESVPEQTWSSAGFLSTTVHGLFGLEVDAVNSTLTLAPHLPADWDDATLSNVQIGNSKLNFAFHQSIDDTLLHIENSGDSVHLIYDPSIPLGALGIVASVNRRRIEAKATVGSEDEHVTLHFDIPHGVTDIAIRYKYGVVVITPRAHPAIAGPSAGMKLTSVSLKGNVFSVDVDLVPGKDNTLELLTRRAMQSATGLTVKKVSGNLYKLAIASARGETSGAYHHERAEVTFAPTEMK